MTGNPRRTTHLLTGGSLLNFYRAAMTIAHPVTAEPVNWQGVEWYFQACKGLYVKGVPEDSHRTSNHQHYYAVEAVRSQPSARDAKAAGRALDIHLPLWNRAAFGYMLAGHIAKFSQHPDLRTELLRTGSKKIVEHRPDPLWGDNMDGTGKNLCGRSLMIVRRMARDWQ